MKHVIALTIVLLSLVSTKNAYAMSENTVVTRRAQCLNALSVIATPKTFANSNPHPGCVPASTGTPQTPKKDKHHNNTHPAITTTITNDTVSNSTPAHSVPVVTHETKNKCNNGNGNGSEGCNASDKGNNDETQQKGDKDINHPTH